MRNRKRELFQETSDTKVDRDKAPLPGKDVRSHTGPFATETADPPPPVRVGFRAFDRQWLIADARLIHRPSPDLWSARLDGQVFVIEQSAHPIDSGPGLLFTGLIPDMHHFNNRGGRALPMVHPDGSPNAARTARRATEDSRAARLDRGPRRLHRCSHSPPCLHRHVPGRAHNARRSAAAQH
jgi:hypothetical protein